MIQKIESSNTVTSSEVIIKKLADGSFQLTTNLFVPLPRAEVFEFFSDANQLERITPPWVNFSILTPQPIELEEGALIDYRLRLRFVPVRWRTEICVWQPPFKFVDQQLKGPYKRWYHEHIFTEVDGGTLVEDAVSYRVPGGALIHRLFVKADLVKIFNFRQDTLRDIFNEKIREKQKSADNSIPATLPFELDTKRSHNHCEVDS